MPVEVLNRSPHLPNTHLEFVQLFVILGITLVATYLISNIWLAAGMTFVAFMGFMFDAHIYIPSAVMIAVAATLVGRLRERSRTGKLLTHHAFSLRDLALIGGGFFLYEYGRTQTRGSEATAIANAERLLRFQRWLHLPDEAKLQARFLPHDHVMLFFNKIYSLGFLSAFIGVFIWMAFNSELIYRVMRNAVGVATFTALAFFAIIPMAPPRLTAASGMVDSYARVGLVHGYVNQFAAMPSLHVGWMALAGWGLAHAIGGWKGRVVGAVPPALMMLAVVVTGNHYWLDGIVGALLCVTPAAFFYQRAMESVSVPTASPVAVPVMASAAYPAVSGGDHRDEPRH